jgi:hypothetical protein
MDFKRLGIIFASMFLVTLCFAQDAKEMPGSPGTGEKSPCSDWSAWSNRMPGSQSSIHVKATCTFPTGGYKVSLNRGVPQGINPQILLLDLKIAKPTGMVTQQITKQEVKFDEKTKSSYTQVQIRPDNVTVDVKISQ